MRAKLLSERKPLMSDEKYNLIPTGSRKASEIFKDPEWLKFMDDLENRVKQGMQDETKIVSEEKENEDLEVAMLRKMSEPPQNVPVYALEPTQRIESAQAVEAAPV